MYDWGVCMCVLCVCVLYVYIMCIFMCTMYYVCVCTFVSPLQGDLCHQLEQHVLCVEMRVDAVFRNEEGTGVYLM